MPITSYYDFLNTHSVEDVEEFFKEVSRAASKPFDYSSKVDKGSQTESEARADVQAHGDWDSQARHVELSPLGSLAGNAVNQTFFALFSFMFNMELKHDAITDK